MMENCGFQPLSGKLIIQSTLDLDVYTYLMSLQSLFAFGPRWPNFGSLVAKRLLKMVVFNRYQEN